MLSHIQVVRYRLMSFKLLIESLEGVIGTFMFCDLGNHTQRMSHTILRGKIGIPIFMLPASFSYYLADSTDINRPAG